MRYVVAVLTAGALIGALFTVKPIMLAASDPYGRLTLLQRILIELGFFWSKFGWLFSPFIVATAIVIAALLPKGKSAAGKR